MTVTQTSTRLADVLARYAEPGQPAVVVGIVRDGAVVEHALAGLASLEHDVPATVDTLFDIASVSKQFTSTCILLLERDGKLSLEDDLRDHLPGLALRERVTLRQLAQHTGGVREYMALNALVGAGESSWKTEEQVIRQLGAYRDTDFPPGTQWSYSNTGYIALAAVVRRVSGSSLAEFAAERLLGPLGMTSSRFSDDVSAIVRGRANGYAKADDVFVRADSPDEVVGDGALVTNLPDLARWAAFLDDGRVLGTDIRDRLLTRAVLTNGREIPYALGIEHETVHGRAAVAHGGAISGYRAHVMHLVDEHLGVVVLANRSDADVAGVARQAAAVVLGADSAAPAQRPAAEAPAEPAGLWFTAREEMFLATRVDEGDRLVLEMGGGAIPFVPKMPGAWRPESLGADVTLRISGDRLDLEIGDDWNATHYDRVRPDGVPIEAETHQGTFASVELGALARLGVTDEGATLQVGAAPELPLTRVSERLFRTPTHTIQLERAEDGSVAALLVSGGRMRGVRFDRVPAGTQARGFPICLGGPLP